MVKKPQEKTQTIMGSFKGYMSCKKHLPIWEALCSPPSRNDWCSEPCQQSCTVKEHV